MCPNPHVARTRSPFVCADFVLSYAKNGELLHWIRKLGSFDEESTRFYAAELVVALEYMHSKGVIHRWAAQ